MHRNNPNQMMQDHTGRKPRRKHPIRNTLLLMIAVPFVYGMVSEAHDIIQRQNESHVTHAKSAAVEVAGSVEPEELPSASAHGTWSNEGTWSNAGTYEKREREPFVPPYYESDNWKFLEDVQPISHETTSGFVSEEAEAAYWEGRPWKADSTDAEEAVAASGPDTAQSVAPAAGQVTGPYTYSAEPLDGSIDEYTISDAYVRPKIRTRDTTFVSHIDELHFTDD